MATPKKKFILKPGIVNCLGICNKTFKSKDVSTNRICPSCTKKLAKERGYKTYQVHTDLPAEE